MGGFGLLSSRCGACGRCGPSPCDECAQLLLPAPALKATPPVRSLAAAIAYEGGGKSLVIGVKARHERTAVEWLAAAMAELVPREADLVTWAPTTSVRAARRGIDHAELLASAVGRLSDLRCASTLVRRPGRAQEGRARAERLTKGPSFKAKYALDGLTLVVVDDVTTTGATMTAAATALEEAGASAVHAIAAAAKA